MQPGTAASVWYITSVFNITISKNHTLPFLLLSNANFVAIIESIIDS